MTTPVPPSSHSVGRFTGLVLGLVVFVCIIMIGFAGFLKYELDRAETTLAAPESTLAPDQEAFQKLRRNLGFSGFVGMAQNFAATHDAGLLPEMKAQLKQANDIISRLPEKTTTESRHDLQAIVSTFDAAMQKASVEPASAFTNNDLTPLYGALPVLDSRLESAAASNRVDAQNKLQFWAMLLTLVSWSSLIIAAAMSVGIYLSLRDRNSAPMRALSQSIKNMARGDMRSAIWGMERQDIIGELARSADMARYHFSQLPDMSLLSDQGPVRIRFEGNTKSMFEAMMQLITRDSEHVRNQASTLTGAISEQQEAINLISTRVEAVLNNIERRGLEGDGQLQTVLQTLSNSATSLRNAQEHASDQLNRIVPYLQERVHGIAEIAHITGKQVAQTLNALTLTERSLKNSAEQSQEAITKLSGTADDLGGRLFAAVNLLQASGKVLTETTEKTQSRMNEAIARFGGAPVMPMAPLATVTGQETSGEDATLSPRIEAVVAALEAAQKKLESHLSDDFLPQSVTMAQSLSDIADQMRHGQEKLSETVEQIVGRLGEVGDRLEEQSQPANAQSDIAVTDNQQITELGGQILHMTEKLAALSKIIESAAQKPAVPEEWLTEIKAGFEANSKIIAQSREDILAAASKPSATPVELKEQLRDHWYQMAGQIEATRTELAQTIAQQIERLESRLSSLSKAPEPVVTQNDTQQQMEQQTQILTELVATLSVLDAHMQQLKTDMKQAKG